MSVTTVSQALNGKGRVDKETRRHVQEVAAAMNYRVNHAAVNLLKNRSGVIAMTASGSTTSPVSLGDLDFLIMFMSGASTEALERGFAIVLIPSTRVDAIQAVEVDGAIVIDPVSEDPVREELAKRDIPVVRTGRDADDNGEPWVDNDLRESTMALLSHMEEQGAQRVGMIAPSTMYSYGIGYRAGYLAWCAERGKVPLIAETGGGLSDSSGRAAALELLSQDPRPDAIFAALDSLAVDTLEAARELGLQVPDDVMIAAGTDSRNLVSLKPSITALALNPDVMGKRAVEMLVAQIEDPSAQPSPQIIPSSITCRASTQRQT